MINAVLLRKAIGEKRVGSVSDNLRGIAGSL